MVYIFQTAARNPLHNNIITLTKSGRRYHTNITQSLHSCFRYTDGRKLTI